MVVFGKLSTVKKKALGAEIELPHQVDGNVPGGVHDNYGDVRVVFA